MRKKTIVAISAALCLTSSLSAKPNDLDLMAKIIIENQKQIKDLENKVSSLEDKSTSANNKKEESLLLKKTEQRSEYFEIETGALNVRAYPDSESRILTMLYKGQMVKAFKTVKSNSGSEWIDLGYGYISKKYCKKI